MSQTKRFSPGSVVTRGAPPPRRPTNSVDSSPVGAAGISGGVVTCAEPGAVETPGWPATPPAPGVEVGCGRAGARAVNLRTDLPDGSMNSSVTSVVGLDLR